jgi:hypothetical protein
MLELEMLNFHVLLDDADKHTNYYKLKKDPEGDLSCD